MVDKNAKMANPSDAWKAGNGGSGSSKGRMRSHEAIGIREKRKIRGKGLADKPSC